MWAKQKMSEMENFSDKYEVKLTALGKQFSILTPGTSFIVLETLEQVRVVTRASCVNQPHAILDAQTCHRVLSL